MSGCAGDSHQCQLLTFVASALSSTIQRGSPSPHFAIMIKYSYSAENEWSCGLRQKCVRHAWTRFWNPLYSRLLPLVLLLVEIAGNGSESRSKLSVLNTGCLEKIPHEPAEVGRVLKNCTRVKVLLEIFTQVKVKVIVWIVTWVRVKKVSDKKNYSSS